MLKMIKSFTDSFKNNDKKQIKIEIEKIYKEISKIAIFIKNNIENSNKALQESSLHIDDSANILTDYIKKLEELDDTIKIKNNEYAQTIKLNEKALSKFYDEQKSLNNKKEILVKNKIILKEMVHKFEDDFENSIAKLNISLLDNNKIIVFNLVEKLMNKENTLFFETLDKASLFLDDLTSKLMASYYEQLSNLEKTISTKLNLSLETDIQNFSFEKNLIKSQKKSILYTHDKYGSDIIHRISNPYSFRSVLSNLNDKTFKIGQKEKTKEVTEYYIDTECMNSQIQDFISLIKKNIVISYNELELRIEQQVVIISEEESKLHIKIEKISKFIEEDEQKIVSLSELFEENKFYKDLIAKLQKRITTLKYVIHKGK